MAAGRAGASAALLLLAASLFLAAPAALARHRRGFHEPLFADDEAADAHTVTAGRPAAAAPPAPPSNRSAGAPQTRASTSGSAAARPRSITVSELLKAPATAKRQVAPALGLPDAPIAQQSAARSGSGSGGQHWSALRNYYDKLRPVAVWTDDARARVSPIGAAAGDSQQRLYDDDLQQQQKQIYTVEPARFPAPAGNLRSPFELPTQRVAQLPAAPPAPLALPASCRFGPPAQARFEEPIAQQPVPAGWAYDLPDLPEKMFFSQQQTRARHQQDTFGALVARALQEQLQQEEMSCGPRSLVRSQARLQSGFGEYPAHAGLYNGSQPAEANFLCAATLVHARFALAPASCLANQSAGAPGHLFLRTGDWNVNRKLNDSDRPLIMLVRQVSRLHPFPRYQAARAEHDLALLEWARPIEFAASEYINPACQAQSRSSLRMQACFAPVRNITIAAYFDPDGDGETKLRQDVQMVELPVNLIPHDDAECRRQTKQESFNFQHPNYICSADFRQEAWRARLRQSQFLGAGVYCDEGGFMSLVSMMHPLQANQSADFGYLDLSYYRPWMRNVIAGFG